MPTKTVKITTTHHRQLKIKGAQHGVSLQQYLAFILDITFTEETDIKQARDQFFHTIEPRFDALMQKAGEFSSEENTPPKGGMGAKG